MIIATDKWTDEEIPERRKHGNIPLTKNKNVWK